MAVSERDFHVFDIRNLRHVARRNAETGDVAA
jgi:hypothetical protein